MGTEVPVAGRRGAAGVGGAEAPGVAPAGASSPSGPLASGAAAAVVAPIGSGRHGWRIRRPHAGRTARRPASLGTSGRTSRLGWSASCRIVTAAGVGDGVKAHSWGRNVGASTQHRSRDPARKTWPNGNTSTRASTGSPGAQLADVRLVVGLVGAEGRGSRRVEGSLAGPQPALLDEHLLAVGPHLGDRHLEVGVGSGGGQPEVERRRAQEGEVVGQRVGREGGSGARAAERRPRGTRRGGPGRP